MHKIHKTWLVLTALMLIQSNAYAAGDAAKGKKVFEKMGCIGCHANGGNDVNPRKPLKGKEFDALFADDKAIKKIVREGVTGTPMRAFSKRAISDSDLCNLIAYIRTFK